MANEPCCRDCDEEIFLSNRGLWKAYCLDCATSRTQQAVSRAVASSSGSSYDSYSACSCVEACCRECNEVIELSNRSNWKALCLDCAKTQKDEAVSRAVEWARADERDSHNDACCRECDEVIGVSNKGLWKALCLDCAESKKKRAVEKAEAAHAGEVYDKDGVIDSLSARVRELEARVRWLEGELDEKESEMEEQEERRREEISVLNAALRRKNSSLAAERQSREIEARVSSREIAELRRTHDAHLRTCPAAKNELMLEQGETTTFADVCVAAGDTVFHVHRAILASRSPVFASMLNLPMREASERLIQIEDMSARALEEFLFFLYTGRFQESFDVAELCTEILAAAQKYDVKDMEETLRPLLDAQPGENGTASTALEDLIDRLGTLPLPSSSN